MVGIRKIPDDTDPYTTGVAVRPNRHVSTRYPFQVFGQVLCGVPRGVRGALPNDHRLSNGALFGDAKLNRFRRYRQFNRRQQQE